MGCGGSKDAVVSTNLTEDNNNSDKTKDVAITNQNSKYSYRVLKVKMLKYFQFSFVPPPPPVSSFLIVIS